VNTSASSLVFTDGTNSFTFDVDSGPSYVGTARPSKTLTLIPEYAGGTLSAFYGAGTDSSITGTMTADAEPSADSLRTYYEWSSSQGALNYYTVVVRVKLPADFDAWQTSNAFQFDFNTESTSASNNVLDVRIYNGDDTPGTAVATDTGNAAAGADTWETQAIDDSALDDGSAPDWDAAGETGVIYLRMGSTGDNFVRIGDIRLNYLAKF
jgi:hypothetical protein